MPQTNLAVRAVAAAMLIFGLLGCMDTGQRSPQKGPPEVVSCAESDNAQTCLECGAGGDRLSCCRDPSNCTVVDAVSGGAPLPPPPPPPGPATPRSDIAPPTATP